MAATATVNRNDVPTIRDTLGRVLYDRSIAKKDLRASYLFFSNSTLVYTAGGLTNVHVFPFGVPEGIHEFSIGDVIGGIFPAHTCVAAYVCKRGLWIPFSTFYDHFLEKFHEGFSVVYPQARPN